MLIMQTICSKCSHPALFAKWMTMIRKIQAQLFQPKYFIAVLEFITSEDNRQKGKLQQRKYTSKCHKTHKIYEIIVVWNINFMFYPDYKKKTTFPHFSSHLQAIETNYHFLLCTLLRWGQVDDETTKKSKFIGICLHTLCGGKPVYSLKFSNPYCAYPRFEKLN